MVSFHFGLPTPELLVRVRALGAKILSSTTTVEEARWLEAQGVDAIIAQGVEAGGLATAAIAPLRAKAESNGSGDFSPLWCGQNATGCKEIPAAQLTRELAAAL